MLTALVVFLLLVSAVIYVLRSPKFRLQAIDNVRELHKMFSVWCAAAGGFLTSLIPVMDQLVQAQPQIDAIQSLHGLTSNPTYQLAAGLVTLFGIVARAIQQRKPS